MATAVTKSTCTVQCGVTLWTNMNMASPPAHRLLYRGALSLPDSHLLLDGLTFFAPSHSAGLNLLQNPLALALESMRGRQSLSFLGIEKLRDVWIDASGDVCMDIHPHASISRIYFENVFCLLPDESTFQDGMSQVGVRVALGDISGSSSAATSGATEIIIYAKHSPLSPTQLELHVARITLEPPPPSPRFRRPRPDDPTPRLPPLISEKTMGKRVRGSGEILGSGNGRKSKKGKIATESITTVDVKLNSVGKGNIKEIIRNTEGVARLGSGVRLNGEAVFKVPLPPAKKKASTGVVLERGDHDDVFGSTGALANAKGKGENVDASDKESEKSNKLLLKKITVTQLAAQGISKTHPEFKELFGFVYRGSAFAVREAIKLRPLDKEEHSLQQVVGAHIAMYVSSSKEWVRGSGSSDVGPSTKIK